MNNYHILEFDNILGRLAGLAYTEAAKKKALSLEPSLSEKDAKRQLNETTQARRILEHIGTPPLTAMTDIEKLLTLCEAGDMLLPEQLEYFASFLGTCRRLKLYLKKAETTGSEIAAYGYTITELPELYSEIDRCIRNGAVDDKASKELSDIRRQMAMVSEQVKEKLNSILARNKSWFSDSFVSQRGGHFTLPVKREYKNNVLGSVIEISNTGGTCFIEPVSVGKLQQELTLLTVEEDCEVRKILYTLTAFIGSSLAPIRLNIEAMETLDFLFAKGKLSLEMKASPALLTTERIISIQNARHPLLDAAAAVPLNFMLGGPTRGVVITGPNTGGKTVALKTVGLLSLMAQSGLHVPADETSVFAMHDRILCDIGDGQSITENLSTFSSHMKNIIAILAEARSESLVLLDELGSGTDPAEGMGLAVAIMEELCHRDCLFLTTTHYPEVKEYASHREGLQNARMAFDRQSLMPLYRLEIGEAGESCALYIASRLGMPNHILENAQKAAYGTRDTADKLAVRPDIMAPPPETPIKKAASQLIREAPPQPASTRAERFHIGDSVMVYPQKELGIVYATADEKGLVGVQIKKIKKLIPHKRIKLQVSASELYPDDYDFSIIFDSVANRKARHILDKRHQEGNIVVLKEGEDCP